MVLCACASSVARETFSPHRRRTVYVTGYGVVGASHDAACDGAVTVYTEPACSAAMVLWTTGVVVDTDVLENVRPGLYAAWILSVDGEAVDCLHACAPAQVGVAPVRDGDAHDEDHDLRT